MVKNLPIIQETQGSSPGSGRSSGEGNGNPLQYSCLGNLLDRETWQVVARGVTIGHRWATTHYSSYQMWIQLCFGNWQPETGHSLGAHWEGTDLHSSALRLLAGGCLGGTAVPGSPPAVASRSSGSGSTKNSSFSRAFLIVVWSVGFQMDPSKGYLLEYMHLS